MLTDFTAESVGARILKIVFFTAGFMTHVTCRLTAKNRDQAGTLRSAIEYCLYLSSSSSSILFQAARPIKTQQAKRQR